MLLFHVGGEFSTRNYASQFDMQSWATRDKAYARRNHFKVKWRKWIAPLREGLRSRNLYDSPKCFDGFLLIFNFLNGWSGRWRGQFLSEGPLSGRLHTLSHPHRLKTVIKQIESKWLVSYHGKVGEGLSSLLFQGLRTLTLRFGINVGWIIFALANPLH